MTYYLMTIHCSLTLEVLNEKAVSQPTIYNYKLGNLRYTSLANNSDAIP